MNINLFETIRIFVQVVESGSLSKTADILELHRPTVTKAIQQLERHLGVRLLNRTTRSLHLTSEGEQFYARCKTLLSEVEETMDCFAASKPLSGVLRVDIAVTIANHLIIPQLHTFQQQHPDLQIVIRSSDYQSDLVKEGIDCAVRIGELGNLDVIAKPIGQIKMMTVASPDYLARYGTPKKPAALAGHRAVNFLIAKDNRLMSWKFTHKQGIEEITPPTGIISDNSESFLACGLAGFGILQGQEMAFRPHLQSGKLVEVLPNYPVPSKRLSLIYPHRQAPRKVRMFEEWLKQIVKKA